MAMANFWNIGAMAWFVTVVGWLLAPIISYFVNRFLSYTVPDTSRKLRELEVHTIPSVKQTLRDVEEKLMPREAEDKRSNSDLLILEKMKMDLRSALYEAEDILDLVDYHRIEEQLIRDSELPRSSWVQHLLTAAAACVARCRGSRLGQWIGMTRAGLLQRLGRRGSSAGNGSSAEAASNDEAASGGVAASRDEAAPEESVSTSEDAIIEIPNAGGVSIAASGAESIPVEESVSMVPKHHAWSSDLLLYITNCCGSIVNRCRSMVQKLRARSSYLALCIVHCCGSILSWSASGIAAAGFYGDWSYEVVGIKNNQKDGTVLDSFLRAIDRKRLRERIEQIECIVTESKKSQLFDQQSSSSEVSVKDTNKESSSKIPVKESGREKEEIDDLHRNLKRKVFGRDKVREDICRMLREEPRSSSSSCYSVIGIHGIKGSGKSTLAQYICDYEKDEGNNHFDIVMFIYVSNSFRLDDIFCKMLEQMSQKELEEKLRKNDECLDSLQKELEQMRPFNDKCLKSLRKELEKKLKGRRYLLVLDDLWFNNENSRKLDVLLAALNVGKSGSKILVTAQREDAATALGADQKQIPIPDLEEEDYLSLFMYHALQCAEDDGEHERIGRKIVKRLRRSPMAAVVVAKRLQRNKSINFWETTEKLDVLNETMGALWWSYRQLGADIRRCFEYCSIFPRGHVLTQHELVCMWIAQGFVKTSNATENMEDLGCSYVEELLAFSFVQDGGSYYGSKYITVHDLLHELAERIAGNSSFRIEGSGPEKDIPPEVLHLSIWNNNKTEITEKILKLENLRTLIIVRRNRMDLHNEEYRHDLIGEKVFENIFTRLTKLRLLIIEQRYFNVKVKEYRIFRVPVPASIGQMQHLRYLSVVYSPANMELVFPSTFSKLYHMQILHITRLRLSSGEDTANLRHLRHILGNQDQEIPNIGRLTSLQTIRNFRVRPGRGYELKQLKHLNMLCELWIGGLRYVRSKEEALEACLGSKGRLRSLDLIFEGPDYVPAEVLEGLCPPKDLERLHIWGYNGFPEDHIWGYNGSRYPSWMLSRENPDAPKHLYKLQLSCCIPLVSIPEDSEFFIHLRELHIAGCDSWEALPNNMDRLKSLHKLQLSYCIPLLSFPEDSEFIHLRELHILGCDSWETLPNMDRLKSLQELFIQCCDKIKLLPTLPCSLKRIVIYGECELKASCPETGHENWQKIQHIPTKKFW